MKEKLGPWYLFTGLGIGIVMGVFYSWLVSPVQFLNTDPGSLHPDFRSEYRALIAQAYLADGDIGRAQGRLALLRDVNPDAELARQSERAEQANRPEREVEALAALATGLKEYQPPPTAEITRTDESASNGTESVLEATATPEQEMMILTPTPTLMATMTPHASMTPRVILRVPFTMSNREEVCNPELPEGLVQIEVLDSTGKPVAGVQAVVTWDGGVSTFYTGLNPNISPGYADFIMDPDTNYNLRVGSSGETEIKLEPVQCRAVSGDSGEGAGSTPGVPYRGGWRLRFVQK